MGYPGMLCSPLMAQKAHRNIAINQTNHTLVTQLIVFQGEGLLQLILNLERILYLDDP